MTNGSKKGLLDFSFVKSDPEVESWIGRESVQSLALKMKAEFELWADIQLERGAMRPEGTVALQVARDALSTNFDGAVALADEFRRRGRADQAQLMMRLISSIMNSSFLIGGLTQSHSKWAAQRSKNSVQAEQTQNMRKAVDERTTQLDAAVLKACHGQKVAKSVEFAGTIRPEVFANLGLAYDEAKTPTEEWPATAAIRRSVARLAKNRSTLQE